MCGAYITYFNIWFQSFFWKSFLKVKQKIHCNFLRHLLSVLFAKFDKGFAWVVRLGLC